MTPLRANEYEAASQRAVCFRVDDGGRIRVMGPDARDFLHRMATNDIKALEVGQGARAALLNVNGRMVADFMAWRLGEDEYLLETAAATHRELTDTLERFVIMERIDLEDASGELVRVTVWGPEALAVSAHAIGADAAPEANGLWLDPSDPRRRILAVRRHAMVAWADLYVPAAQENALIAALREAGAEDSTAEVLEVLRVEAGNPKWGAELTPDVIPLEANLEAEAVSLTKGCYPGQEIIARIHARGAPARRLVGIRFSDGIPAPGDAVESDGRAVGAITSAVVSPALGGLALAYLRKGAGAEGAAVQAGGFTGVVSALPFKANAG